MVKVFHFRVNKSFLFARYWCWAFFSSLELKSSKLYNFQLKYFTTLNLISLRILYLLESFNKAIIHDLQCLTSNQTFYWSKIRKFARLRMLISRRSSRFNIVHLRWIQDIKILKITRIITSLSAKKQTRLNSRLEWISTKITETRHADINDQDQEGEKIFSRWSLFQFITTSLAGREKETYKNSSIVTWLWNGAKDCIKFFLIQKPTFCAIIVSSWDAKPLNGKKI